MIQISMIPQEFVGKYNVTEKAHNGYISAQVTKGMYGLPQAGRISHDALVKHLDPYGYHPSRKKRGPWKHKSLLINFTLVVNDFGVKYSGNENDLYLKAELEDKYKVTTDWEGKLYLGIALKWDYKKVTFQLSMPGYVREALNSFQHKKPKQPQDSPYPWKQPINEQKQFDAIVKSTI